VLAVSVVLSYLKDIWWVLEMRRCCKWWWGGCCGGFGLPTCGYNCGCSGLSGYWTFWPLSNLLRFAGLVLSLCWFQICWDLQAFSIWLTPNSSVLIALFGWRLQAETYPSKFSFYCCPSIFGLWSCFLDAHGPITFDSRLGVCVQWLFFGSDWCLCGSMKIVEYPSKYGIRSESLLGGVYFWFLVFGVRLYTAPRSVVLLLPVSVRLVRWPGLLIIYLPFKKKN
jgi:hypothetical protein